MNPIPTLPELEAFGKYLIDINNPANAMARYWTDENEDYKPEKELVLKAYKDFINYRKEQKAQNKLRDEYNSDELLKLPIQRITRFILERPNVVEGWFNDYIEKAKSAEKDLIFKLKLGEMTGYQFEAYLKALGLLPKTKQD